MSEQFEPGTLKPTGLREYLLVCYHCDYRETIMAVNRVKAVKVAQANGWEIKAGKWNCMSHDSYHAPEDGYGRDADGELYEIKGE